MHEVWNQNPSNEDNYLTKKQQWKKSGLDQESAFHSTPTQKKTFKITL